MAGSGSIFLAVMVVDDLCFFFLDTELESPCASGVYVGRQVVVKIGLVFDLDEGSLQTPQQSAHRFEVWTIGFNLAIQLNSQLNISDDWYVASDNDAKIGAHSADGTLPLSVSYWTRPKR